jgi:4-amino-4-deoxy-L-arabinose transferase-like glycosyltransferase
VQPTGAVLGTQHVSRMPPSPPSPVLRDTVPPRSLKPAICIAMILAAIYVAVLWPKIASGTLWHHDELLTGNRAREMVVRGDPFTVTLNYEPDFKKPPLQYWLSALLMQITRNRELAVRLPSLLYGALCLPATVFLAWCCRRRGGNGGIFELLVPGIAVLAFGYFVHISRVGLLDTGSAFYLALVIGGCQLAKKNPRWWWFVGAACTLGAWQKAPYAFGAWILVIALRWVSRKERFGLRSRTFWLALLVSMVAAAGWLALQWIRHGDELMVAAGHEQADTLLRAHDPEDIGFRPQLYWWWLTLDWALVGAVAPVAVIATLISGRLRRELTAHVEVAAVCAIFGVVLALTPYRAERYLIVLIPLLAVVTLTWIPSLIESFSFVPLTQRVLMGIFIVSAFPVAAFHYAKPVRNGPESLLSATHDFRDTLQPGEVIVIDREADPDFNTTDFIQFYASLRRPALLLESYEIDAALRASAAGRNASTYRGIARADQMPRLLRANSRLEAVSRHNEWVLWKCPPKG